MVSRLLFLLSFFLLVIIPQRLDAQFLQRKDSVARIIKQGVKICQQRTDVKKTEGGKKKKVAAVKKKKRAPEPKIVKSAKDKQQPVVYTGKRYHLGERVIMQGDSGADVKSLANLLVKKLFLDEKDIIYTSNGVLYDGEIVRSVRMFQKISGLYEDGMVGTPTLKALRKYR